MILDYMREQDIFNIGCLIIIDDVPHVFIMQNGELLEGIPLEDDDGMYDGIEYNDVVLVGVNVLENSKTVSPSIIDDENVSKLTYNIVPLYIYTIKTFGLVAEDFIDLNLFKLIFDEMVKLYENQKLI